jgi:hypothetical protein
LVAQEGNMDRREFLVRSGAVMLILPAGWAVSGCSDDDDDGDLLFTSSTIDGHSHQITLTMAELQSPPTSGLSRDTSSNDGHTHRVELSADDLSRINLRQTVSKETSLVNGHTHTFTFLRG